MAAKQMRKRITTKQKRARRKNIAIARKSRHKNRKSTGGFFDSVITAQLGRRKNTSSNRRVALGELRRAFPVKRSKAIRRIRIRRKVGTARRY